MTVNRVKNMSRKIDNESMPPRKHALTYCTHFGKISLTKCHVCRFSYSTFSTVIFGRQSKTFPAKKVVHLHAF